MEFREATLVAFGIEMGRRVMSLKRQSCCHQASCHRKGRSGCGCFGVLLLDFVVVVVWGAREGGGVFSSGGSLNGPTPSNMETWDGFWKGASFFTPCPDHYQRTVLRGQIQFL